MQVVHIYAETGNTAPRSMLRKTGYVLEYITPSGESITREQFRDRDGTYNAATLQMLTESLKRLKRPCEVHIHTQNRYILLMIDTRLEEWAKNGYCTAKGDKLAHWEDWEKLEQASAEHLLVPEPGEHAYLEWLQNEMKKPEKADKSKMKRPQQSQKVEE